MKKNPICEMLGIKYPVIQGGMAWIADAYLAAERKDTIIQNFYNDTYFSDQNACTAPRIIFWQGEKKEEAKK